LNWHENVEGLRAEFGDGTRFDVAREWLRDYMLELAVPVDSVVGGRLFIHERTVRGQRRHVIAAGLPFLPEKAVASRRGRRARHQEESDDGDDEAG
jgi:hypothetical protein